MLFGVQPYWMLLYSLPIALLLRPFLLRRDHTLAEIRVAVMYAVGLATAINVPTTAALAFSGISMAVQMNTTQGLIILAQFWVLDRFSDPDGRVGCALCW